MIIAYYRHYKNCAIVCRWIHHIRVRTLTKCSDSIIHFLQCERKGNVSVIILSIHCDDSVRVSFLHCTLLYFVMTVLRCSLCNGSDVTNGDITMYPARCDDSVHNNDNNNNENTFISQSQFNYCIWTACEVSNLLSDIVITVLWEYHCHASSFFHDILIMIINLTLGTKIVTLHHSKSKEKVFDTNILFKKCHTFSYKRFYLCSYLP